VPLFPTAIRRLSKDVIEKSQAVLLELSFFQLLPKSEDVKIVPLFPTAIRRLSKDVIE